MYAESLIAEPLMKCSRLMQRQQYTRMSLCFLCGTGEVNAFISSGMKFSGIVLKCSRQVDTQLHRDKCNWTVRTIQLCWNRSEQVKRFICPFHAQVQHNVYVVAGSRTHTHMHTSGECSWPLIMCLFGFFLLSLCVLITQSVCINYQVCAISLLASAICTEQSPIWAHYTHTAACMALWAHTDAATKYNLENCFCLFVLFSIFQNVPHQLMLAHAVADDEHTYTPIPPNTKRNEHRNRRAKILEAKFQVILFVFEITLYALWLIRVPGCYQLDNVTRTELKDGYDWNVWLSTLGACASWIFDHQTDNNVRL